MSDDALVKKRSYAPGEQMLYGGGKSDEGAV
jgi:hypothetical protein